MRMFGSILVTILALLLISSSSLLAKDKPNIVLGTATLSLHMNKDAVIKYLARTEMELTPTTTGESSYWVSYKNSPHEHLAQIVFDKGKLVFISKYWGSFCNKDAFSFVKALFSSLSDTLGSKEEQALITLSIYPQPKYESKNINMFIGPYEININSVEKNESDAINCVSITQYLKDYKSMP